jgi:hypothetical protein
MAMAHPMRRRVLRSMIPALAALLLWTLAAIPARAATWGAVAGAEYYDGPGTLTTRGALLGGVLGLRGVELTAVGVRYDDSVVGKGVSATGGLAVPLGEALAVRAQGTRFLGDGDYRAWRAKVGPQFTLPGQGALMLWYVRYQDNQSQTSDAAALEGAVPVTDRWTAKLDASYGSASQGLSGGQAALGASWIAFPHLELTGEVGLAQQNAVLVGGPQGGPGRLPILGALGPGNSGSGSQTEQPSLSTTVLLGVRVVFP